jgi:predicted Zn finger-like uncharacterized protein
MTLRTTCSECHSVFNISEQQLAAADGWAQCGVCGASFDALGGMPDEERGHYLSRPESVPVSKPVAGTPVPARREPIAPPTPVAVVLADTALTEPVTEPVTESHPDPKSTAEPPAQGVNLPGLERRFAAQTEGPSHSALPSIIILDPDAEVPDDFGPLPEIPALNDYPYGLHVHELEDDDDDEGEAEAAPPAVALVSRPIPGEASFVPPQEPSKKWPLWAWIIVVLLIVLPLGQLAYFLRDPLAARYPELRPLLSTACIALGCRMGLPQDADQIKILGSDLQADPNNSKRLTLTLTLANQATYQQAWPMLQLTLNDTNDTALARRVFAPSEYLNHPGMMEAGMPPLSETPLSLHLEAKDLNPSGFRVEVFY